MSPVFYKTAESLFDKPPITFTIEIQRIEEMLDITIAAPVFNADGNVVDEKPISYNFNADVDKINDETLNISRADLLKFIINPITGTTQSQPGNY